MIKYQINFQKNLKFYLRSMSQRKLVLFFMQKEISQIITFNMMIVNKISTILKTSNSYSNSHNFNLNNKIIKINCNF